MTTAGPHFSLSSIVRRHPPSRCLYVVGFLAAVVGSLALTPLVRGAARRYDLFDPEDERKVHGRKIPRIGGVAIFLAVMATLGLLWGVSHDVEWGDAGKLSVISPVRRRFTSSVLGRPAPNARPV